MRVTIMRGDKDRDPGSVIGWVRDGHGCENPACHAAIAQGRTVHAIPAVGTLPTYHYTTRAEAVTAVRRAMIGQPGRATAGRVGH